MEGFRIIWSSAAAHIAGENDRLVSVEPMLSMIPGNWRQFLAGTQQTDEMLAIRKHERTGRPLGDAVFVEGLEKKPGMALKPGKPGPKVNVLNRNISNSGN